MNTSLTWFLIILIPQGLLFKPMTNYDTCIEATKVLELPDTRCVQLQFPDLSKPNDQQDDPPDDPHNLKPGEMLVKVHFVKKAD